MKPVTLLLATFLFFYPRYSFGQVPVKIQHVRLGNVKKHTTHYGKYPYSEAKTTYDAILANPRLVCDVAGYKVSRYTLTFIPHGKDLAGPYHVTGAELTERDRNWITNRKDERSHIKIVIEDIQLIHNGQEDTLIGTLIYDCN
jgi:hypothetical protein